VHSKNSARRVPLHDNNKNSVTMSTRSCFRTFAGAAITSAAAALFVIGVATPVWKTDDGEEFGLWKFCNSNGDSCQQISLGGSCDVGQYPLFTGNDCTKFGAVRAMAILAVIFGVVAAFIQLLVVAILRQTKHRWAGAILGLLAFVCGLAAMSIMVSINNSAEVDNRGNWGYSFVLETLGWLLMLPGTIYFMYESEVV